ncbi:MAG: SPOR domain-containing protein [Nitrosomonadales bacterium]
MSKNNNSRAPASSGKGGSLFVAVLIGMVLGLALAGGVAWYILNRPNPFVNNVPHEAVKLTPDVVKPPVVPVVKVIPEAVPVEVAASGVVSGVGEGKPRFEFYKVLTDKQDALPTQSTTNQPDKAAVKEKEAFFLQAGAFANADDADKLKAKLAMLGMEASVQDASLPDKTVWHRVRLGPYRSLDEMNKASSVLKQNGVHATPMRAQ